MGLLGGLLFAASGSQALGQIDDGLISYWPLDEVQGTKTPDLISFYDMELVNLTSDDLVDGKHGKAFSFSNERQTLLQRVHEPSDNLPANKHESYTLSMWVNVTGEGQNDLRIFSEGNTSNSNPLFNMGTHNGGADGSLDFYLRQSGWDTFGHAYSIQQPFDGSWHHIALVQSDGARTFYVDGVADELEIPDKPEGDWLVNNTSIGGILRAAASHWVTGLIDDVAIWNRALTESELGELSSSALGDLLGGQEADPVAEGLVAHWPLDVIQGTKTPDKVNGYDMELTNLSESDVVAGKVGNAFSFSNERQTLLSRVHEADEDLPANKHESYTLSMWVNVVGEGQNDLRIFSEGNTSNSNPLFNMGTHNGGADGSLDFYLRQSGWDTFGHAYSEQQPFDGTWRHIAFVQTNGARTLYVDGVADALEIPDKPEGDWLVNNSSIGGILRAAASHWATGLIDEVAVWKRALSEDEVNSVITNGVPSAGGGNQRPLAIASFSAEYASVAKGGTVVLQWDASPDASLWVSHGVGDVTANSEFGVGSVEVPLEGTSNFTLYASRGSDTVSASTMVTAYDGIADGWTLIQDFESMNTDASVNGQERWKNPEGTTAVIETGTPSGNALTLSGTALSAVLLGSQTILEGEKATLFFRAYTAEGDGGSVQVNVGLSEKPIRFIGDFDADVGPFVQFGDLEGFLDLLSIDGYGGTLDWTGKSVDYETTYNVWLDVDNRNLDDGDKFTMYFQKASGGDREEGFKDYTSDRNPAGSVDLGLPGPDLDTIFVSSHNNGIQQGQFLIDDIYISKGSFNDGIPAEIDGLNATDEITDDSTPPGGGGTGEPAAAAMVASSDGALSAPAVVDFGALDGSASFEFHFTAIKAGASTAIAGNDAFAIKLDQWNEQGVFGTTEFGVADNLFTAVEGGSVNSVFDAPVHVVIVSDTAAGESHLYIDGALSGTWAGNIPFSGDTKVMGARLEQATDHMGEGSVMHSWATYSGLLTAAEITSKFEALPDVSTGGGDGEVDLLNGLVALWNFDDGTFNDSVGGFNGEERGAAPIGFTDGPGGYGSALALDGVDQFVEITGGAAEDLTFEGGSMTLSAWFRVGAFDKGWQALIAKGEGDRWRVHRRGGDGSGLAHAGGVGEGPAGADISLGEWHHLVAVTDGDAVEFGTRLYVDGEIYSENAATPSLGENGKRVMIGGNPDTGNRTWNGDIDDIALWDRALSGAEVASLLADGPITLKPTILPLDGVADAGSGLDGRYWQAEPKAVLNLQDKGEATDIGLHIVNNYYPTGTFTATGLDFQGGNDLTPIREWLQGDGESYVGADGNMDDGILSFTGYIRIDNPGEIAIRSASDDGSIVWIAGQKVVDNDGSHGAPGPSPDGSYNFEEAGLYPIEVAYFNGDWTNDAGEHGGANLGITANGDPIPGAILYSASDIGATAIAASSIAAAAGDAGLHAAYWTTEPKGAQFGEDSQGPIFQNVQGDDHGLALFGTEPQGRFVATTMTYTGNDLTPILEWLGDDSGSFIGTEGNLDDGIFQFTGLLNVAEAGQHSFRSSSDDGSVVRIGNQIVVNNDGGHGSPGPAPDGNAFFPVAGLYPIEVAYFNGDWTNDDGDHGGANIELTMNGESIAGHLRQPLGGLPSVGFSSILLDFGGTEGSGAGASPSPWVTIDSLTQDEPVDLGGGVTLTALDDGYTANNPAPPNEGAEYAGIMVPQEARNDYLFKNTDTAGTEARMQITGLPAGTYDVTVFEGRTTDASQFAKIWAGDGNEPDAENTGTFAGDHATVTVTVGEGETLWYKHLEDNSGGISGMIIQMAGGSAGGISAVTLQDGNITIEYTGTLKSSATVNGEFSAVDGASSPYSVAADQDQAFFIAE